MAASSDRRTRERSRSRAARTRARPAHSPPLPLHSWADHRPFAQRGIPMSVSVSFPGIYIEELPLSAHAISPAPTSIAAFVGYTHPLRTTAGFNTAVEL